MYDYIPKPTVAEQIQDVMRRLGEGELPIELETEWPGEAERQPINGASHRTGN